MIKCKQHHQKPHSSDSGFTIIESIVALLIAAILLAAIAPVLVFSTATRVQSRRVELATRAAKTFIDGVRTGAKTRNNLDITVPSDITPTLAAPSTTIKRNLVDRPGDYLTDTTKMPAPDNTTKGDLYCFNEDSTISNPDCTSNTDKLFYIQARRIVQSTSNNDGYRLAIRVYRADVNFSQTVKVSTTTNSGKQATYAAGLGDRQAPVIEMTTDIANGSTTFQALCQRLGTATNQSCQ